MADTRSVTAAGTETASAFTPQSDTVAMYLQLKADNAGTPASGDTVTFKLLASVGDLDATSEVADEFASQQIADVVAVLDTNTVDPAISNVINLPLCKSFKIRAENDAAANSITVSGRVFEVGVDGAVTRTMLNF